MRPAVTARASAIARSAVRRPSGCPSGFSCSLSENLCRSGETAQPCAAALGDAGAHDAAIDVVLGDAPIPATLSETTNSVVGTDILAQCDPSNASTTDAATWYRAFQLSDPHFGITDTFDVTQVSFGVERALGGLGINTVNVTVAVGLFSGDVSATTIDVADIMLFPPTISVPVPNSETPQTLSTSINATIPAGGTFIVEVSAPKFTNEGYFTFGATDAMPGEWLHGWILCDSAAIEAQTTPFIIDVAGTH